MPNNHYMTGKTSIRFWCNTAFLVIFFLICAPASAISAPQGKTILVLHSYNREYRWTEDINTGIMKALETMSEAHLVCVEYLDWKRFPSDTNISMLHDFWRNKYRNVPISVIITSDDKALEFATKYRDELFSGAPIVFTGVYPESVQGLTGGAKNITGVYEEQDILTTVRIALKIQPSPRAAYIINDDNESGQAVESHLRNMIHSLVPAIPIWSLSNLSIENIETYVSNLSKQDLVFIGTYSVDKTGKTYTGETLIGRVGMASKTPVYILNTHHLGTGAFGGNLLSPELLGKHAGELAMKILGGIQADRIVPLSASSFTPMFDWNSVRRLGLNVSKLPRNSVFLNREIPFFIRYRYETIILAVVFALLLIAFNLTLFNYRKAHLLAKDLAERNTEVVQLNEALSQSEEELRQQFTEISFIKETLEESEERYRLSSIGSNDALWDWNYAARKLHYSSRWYDMTGFDPNKNTSIRMEDIVHSEDLDSFQLAYQAHLGGETDHFHCEVRIKIPSGRYMWILVRGKIVKNEKNEPVRFAGSITDIDDRKHKEEEIENLAYYDQLTSMPNRTLALETAEKALECNKEGEHCGLMFIDIDNFKYINDTFGHPVGDKILQQSALVLSSLVNEQIHLARVGGDEFTLLVENTTQDQMEKFGKLALRLLGRKMQIDGRYHFLTASAGIALYPDHASSLGDLFQKADAALHRAKFTGKPRFFMFNSAIQKELIERMEIESGLRTAIEDNELWVAYQPQIDIDTHRIAGFEALARWNSHRFGNIPPSRFIPIAEESGQIDELGLFILKSAAKFITRASKIGYQDFTVSINVSVKQLHDPNFVSHFVKVLNTHEVEANRIAIEITESFMIEDLDPVVSRLTELRNAGFKLSLDDFGKGYSSLSYLRSLPLDYIKIDKCFIDDILANGPTIPLAKTIIELSHQLGLKVVAEGVEIKEQLDYLRGNGCDFIQGYYYSKPDQEDAALGQLELSFS